MDDLQLLYYCRVLKPDNKVFTCTWRKKNPMNQNHLGYILISESLPTLVEKYMLDLAMN